MKSKLPSLLILSVALVLLAACAATAPSRAALPNGPFAGEYAGTWQSVSGHHGKLTCRFAPVDASHSRAHFTAWWLTFHTSYDTVFQTRQRGGKLSFEGVQDLGYLRGGLYHYTGRIFHGQWSAEYQAASGDHGTFTMVRE